MWQCWIIDINKNTRYGILIWKVAELRGTKNSKFKMAPIVKLSWHPGILSRRIFSKLVTWNLSRLKLVSNIYCLSTNHCVTWKLSQFVLMKSFSSQFRVEWSSKHVTSDLVTWLTDLNFKSLASRKYDSRLTLCLMIYDLHSV